MSNRIATTKKKRPEVTTEGQKISRILEEYCELSSWRMDLVQWNEQLSVLMLLLVAVVKRGLRARLGCAKHCDVRGTSTLLDLDLEEQRRGAKIPMT